jgi:iron complex outermembrane receptor protein
MPPIAVNIHSRLTRIFVRAVACASACALLPHATRAQAQASTAQTDTTKSDSTRRSTVLTPMSVTGERARAAPPPVARIDVKPGALVSTPAANAYDLVRRVTGIEVHEQGQGPGFTSNAVIRGFNSDHSADVLLVVDGIPINAPIHGHVEGFADWNVLLPGAVNSMRVIHGTASPLYGDFSLAGVVEVFTDADATGTTGGLTSSSFGDAGAWIKTGRRASNGGFAFATDIRRQQGWQRHSDYNLGNALLRGWRVVSGGRLEGGVQFYRSGWNSPGFVSVARYNTRDLRAAVDSTDGGDASRLLAHLRYSRALGSVRGFPLAMEATAWGQGGSQRMYLNIPGQGLVLRQSGEEDKRSGAGGQVQFVWRIPLGELVLGASGRRDQSDYTLRSTLARQTSSFDHSYDARFASTAAFVRWRRLIASRLALDVGARLDQLHYEAEDRLENAGWKEGTTTVASPKLGARYLLPVMPRGAMLSLLASSSHGFRGPVGVIADPTRVPFLAWSHELGFEIERDDLSWHAAYFRIDTDNERIFNPVTLGISSAGQSRREGLDVRTTWRAPEVISHALRLEAFELFSAFTLNNARFLGTAAVDTGGIIRPPSNQFHDHNVPILPGDPVPGIAKYTGRIGGEARLAGARQTAFRASYRLLGPFTPIGEPGVQTRTAGVVDAGVSVNLFANRSSLDLDAQNLFDMRYVENRASGFITPGVPRSLRVGLRLQ